MTYATAPDTSNRGDAERASEGCKPRSGRREG